MRARTNPIVNRERLRATRCRQGAVRGRLKVSLPDRLLPLLRLTPPGSNPPRCRLSTRGCRTTDGSNSFTRCTRRAALLVLYIHMPFQQLHRVRSEFQHLHRDQVSNPSDTSNFNSDRDDGDGPVPSKHSPILSPLDCRGSGLTCTILPPLDCRESSLKCVILQPLDCRGSSLKCAILQPLDCRGSTLAFTILTSSRGAP